MIDEYFQQFGRRPQLVTSNRLPFTKNSQVDDGPSGSYLVEIADDVPSSSQDGGKASWIWGGYGKGSCRPLASALWN